MKVKGLLPSRFLRSLLWIVTIVVIVLGSFYLALQTIYPAGMPSAYADNEGMGAPAVCLLFFFYLAIVIVVGGLIISSSLREHSP